MINNQLSDFLYETDRDGYALTKFLDFEEQRELSTLISKDIDVIFYGGYEAAERKRGIVYNKMYEMTNDYFGLVAISSPYSTKFYDFTHRHVLGTIMGLGIERNCIGDICLSNGHVIIFTTEEMSEYLINNLTEINHQKMFFRTLDNVELEEAEEVVKTINVASYRLDAIVSKLLGKSREDAKYFIKQGYIKVNQIEETDPDTRLDIGDILSIRKYGRVEIKDLQNVSKKDRLNLIVGIKH